MEFCVKHPKYRGKGKPKHECVKCLNIYAQFGMTRKPIAPPKKVMSSKKDKLNSRQQKKLQMKKGEY